MEYINSMYFHRAPVENLLKVRQQTTDIQKERERDEDAL